MFFCLVSSVKFLTMDSEVFQYFPVLKDFQKGGIFYEEKIDFKMLEYPFVPEKIRSFCIETCYQDSAINPYNKINRILTDYILTLFGLIGIRVCKKRPIFTKIRKISQEQIDAIQEYFGESFFRDFIIFQQK